MSVECFLKYFALAVGIQVMILVFCIFVPGLGDFMLFYVYWPEIRLADILTGAQGEDTMIVSPVLGLLGGFILYSLVAGIVVCLFKSRKRLP